MKIGTLKKILKKKLVNEQFAVLTNLSNGTSEVFKLEKRNQRQIITHTDPKIFNDWGFVSEEPPYKQLKLILE